MSDRRSPIVLLMATACVLGCSAQRHSSVPDDAAGSLLAFEVGSDSVVELVYVPFVPARHRIGLFHTTNEAAAVVSIDGKPFFGSDLGLPERALVAGTLVLSGGRRISLEVDGLFDSGGGEVCGQHFEFNGKECLRTSVDNGCVLVGHLGCCAGAYEVEWEIAESGSVRTSIRRTGGATSGGRE